MSRGRAARGDARGEASRTVSEHARLSASFFSVSCHHVNFNPDPDLAPHRTGRVMLGATDPLKSDPGSIRGAYALEVGRNVCHGSDTVENAQKEIKLWFPEGINSWTSAAYNWVYEK